MTFTADDITSWHAHVYYDADSRDIAARLRAEVEDRFDVTLGRWREEPVGPHPQPMYQIAFDAALFAELVPWLLTRREGLSILVHANTGLGDLADHTVGAMWLGRSLELNLDVFDRDGRSF